MNESMNHERARRLSAVRLDQDLPPGDEADLEAHLATCSDCRAVAAGYESDRLALRALPPIEPPRDLWARTSAALEREHARRPRSMSRSPRPWGPVAVLGGGFALVLALALVGPGLLSSSQATPGVVAVASNGGPGPIASIAHLPTPIVVPPAEVTWVVTKGPGSLSLVTASVSKVCPAGDEPDCGLAAGVSRSLATLPTVPSSLVLSPSNASQAVAIGPAPNKNGTTLFVMAVPAESTASPAPAASASAGPLASPTPTEAAGASPSPRSSATVATPSPTASRAPASPTPVPSASPAPPSPSAAVSPPPVGTPAPSTAATLAILSNVTLVGDEAAYSSDGQWFAFSARPAGTATGPDIYVWQAGWPSAKPLTTDHASVFSGWVAGRILASRAIPVSTDGSPLPSSPAASGSPAASPVSGGTPTPTATSTTPSEASPSAAAASDGDLAGSSLSAALATPAAFLIDPASGLATRIAGLDGWRPVVDPSGTWVAYWAGTLRFDAASGMWQPFQGGLQVASWSTVSTAADGATGAAAAHALPLVTITDWDVRWDRTGDHLGVWIADADNPGLGSLSLLTIDPASGLTSSNPPVLLNDTPALRGFALKDGQLVWATPPGQDGKGSQLSVLAWSGANAGKTSVEPIDGGAVFIVPSN